MTSIVYSKGLPRLYLVGSAEEDGFAQGQSAICTCLAIPQGVRIMHLGYGFWYALRNGVVFEMLRFCSAVDFSSRCCQEMSADGGPPVYLLFQDTGGRYGASEREGHRPLRVTAR